MRGFELDFVLYDQSLAFDRLDHLRERSDDGCTGHGHGDWVSQAARGEPKIR